MEKKYNKVFGIGMHKTGTSTLGKALVDLDFSVLGARLDMIKLLMEDDYLTPFELAGQYDALQDIPWAILYKELDYQFPNSKFILTERDEASWMKSVQNHFGGKKYELHSWIYGTPVVDGNEKIYLDRYRRHYQEVREYFKDRPNDLLILSWERGDGWDKLCPFLELPIPQKPFPHANKGTYNYSFKEKAESYVRDLTPMFVRKSRIQVLKIMGLYGDKDIFNNKEHNQYFRGEKVDQ